MRYAITEIKKYVVCQMIDNMAFRTTRPLINCIRRQAIVDSCLHFIGTESIMEKGGKQ